MANLNAQILMVSRNSEKLLVELKRSGSARAVEDGTKKLARFMNISRITQGILFNYPTDGRELAMHSLGVEGRRLVVLAAEEHHERIVEAARSHFVEIHEVT